MTIYVGYTLTSNGPIKRMFFHAKQIAMMLDKDYQQRCFYIMWYNLLLNPCIIKLKAIKCSKTISFYKMNGAVKG